MKKILSLMILTIYIFVFFPFTAFASGGIYASGGGTRTEGETFSISIVAKGDEFDAVQGKFSVGGNLSVLGVSAGGATWLPGKSPSNGGEFVGITSPTKSLTVATVRLKAGSTGSGSVSVSGVKLARNGSIVGSASGGASVTINRALVPAGNVTVTSSTHPDQNTEYEAKTIQFAWDRPNNATDFSTVFDQVADTNPEAKSTTADTTATQTVEKIGSYYFHIRAKNADGWGGATHFKVNIKASVDNSLAKTEITSIEKSADSKVDLENGTLSNIVFKGKALKGYTLRLNLNPVVEGMTATKIVGEEPSPSPSVSPTISESTEEASISPSPTATAEATATPSSTNEVEPTAPTPSTEVIDWEILSDNPLKAGFYKVSAQSQYGDSLTPDSGVIMFEVTLANGGDIRILTEDDLNPASAKTLKVLGIDISKHPLRWTAILTALFVLIIVALTYISKKLIWKKLARKKPQTPDKPYIDQRKIV